MNLKVRCFWLSQKPLQFLEQMDRMNSGWKSMWFSRLIYWVKWYISVFTLLILHMSQNGIFWSLSEVFFPITIFLAHYTLINLNGCPCSVMAWYSKSQRIKNSRNSVKREGHVHIDNCWERIHGKREKILTLE